MKICIPGKKLGRLKQQKRKTDLFRVEARPKKRPMLHNCSFQRSPGRTFKKAQTAKL